MSTSKSTGARNKVISCAECRRLKLRCDRKFPCRSCTKRGLGAICPEGSLPTRPKVLLEETERLSRKNAEYLERIHLLEDGLATLQASVSEEPHPLLSKTQLDGGAVKEAGSFQHQGELDEVNDSLGTLTIDAEGRSLFLGQTAGIESLFRNELRQIPKSEKPASHSPSVLHTLGIFSNLNESKQIVMDVLKDYLPSSKLAWSLSELYFKYGDWLYNFVPKTMFLEQVYNHVYSPESEQGTLNSVSSHNAALLFMIFAMGSILDPSRPPDTDDAEQYHQLARTALSCDAILVDPTIPAIRTLLLMAFYHLLRDTNGPQHSWALVGLVSHMAQNIGLHRDSQRWKLDEALVQERRTLFWELYYFSMNQSLNFGRPPSMLLSFCDAEQPRNAEHHENRQGEIKPGFHQRKHQFAYECLSQVIEAVLGVKHTPYSTVLAIDRKVRDCQALKAPPNGATGPLELGTATVELTLQRFMLKAYCEWTLMYLHRRYFALAVRDYPEDILGCRYGPSVLAIYHSACVYISLMRCICTLHPQIANQYFVIWNHLLAASILVGSVATKCPKCVLAPSAVSELDGCFVLFEKAASFGDSLTRPARALKIVSKLRDRAHILQAAVQSGTLPDNSVQKLDDNTSEQPDELSILGGRGRLVAAKPGSPSQSQGSTSRSHSIAPLPQRSLDQYDTAHPSLMDNLRIATGHPTAIPWGDVNMWDTVPNLPEAISMTSATSSPWSNLPLDLESNASAGTTTTPSPPMFFTPSQTAYNSAAIPGYPEESGHDGQGIAMSWESNWQGFMQQLQLGVQYDSEGNLSF